MHLQKALYRERPLRGLRLGGRKAGAGWLEHGRRWGHLDLHGLQPEEAGDPFRLAAGAFECRSARGTPGSLLCFVGRHDGEAWHAAVLGRGPYESDLVSPCLGHCTDLPLRLSCLLTGHQRAHRQRKRRPVPAGRGLVLVTGRGNHSEGRNGLRSLPRMSRHVPFRSFRTVDGGADDRIL